METKIVIRGRRITEDEITFVRSIIERHFSQGRTFISKELCHLWNWRQPNGSLKQMASYELLLRLERKGLVKLPATKNGHKGGPRAKRPIQIPPHSRDPIHSPLHHLLPLQIKMVRFTQMESLYKGLIEAYHYLGYSQTVGEHLYYIVFHKDRPLACIGWGQAAWKVACRDDFIGWRPAQKEQRLHLIAQNTRFLILPWVKVPNLCSHILGRISRVLPQDWEDLYNHPIALLETFVDSLRFKGTCYAASNWIRVGFTKGRGKWDTHYQYPSSIKAVFLYPLRRDFQEVLAHHD